MARRILIYLALVRDIETWGVGTQVGLEVEGSDPAVLGQIRQLAPQAPHPGTRGLVHGGSPAISDLWHGFEPRTSGQRLPVTWCRPWIRGFNDDGEGLVVLVPRSTLNHPQPRQQVERLRDRLNDARATLNTQMADHCDLWVSDVPATPQHPYADLIVQLFDLGCILFGDYVQSSGATFPYYVDLRQIISNPQIFQKILKAYGDTLQTLNFERIAGIPYGSLPTATGLSLQLDRPMVFPRKEVKPHGTQRVVEGALPPRRDGCDCGRYPYLR